MGNLRDGAEAIALVGTTSTDFVVAVHRSRSGSASLDRARRYRSPECAAATDARLLLHQHACGIWSLRRGTQALGGFTIRRRTLDIAALHSGEHVDRRKI